MSDKIIVNVASVPQRSPFRYPGGKTWLIPTVRKWLNSLSKKPVSFIEPFAGSAIISLTVAAEDLASEVTIVELDSQVAAVWKVILNGNARWLAYRVSTFDMTPESIQEVLSQSAPSLEEKAFQTLLRNRISRGGILAPGSGVIKEGENGKGIRSRWYPETLKQRILDIEKIKHKIHFIEGDGIKFLRKNNDRKDVAFFIDPPYTAPGKKAGTRLYEHSELDHEELFRIIKTLAGDFLATYDDNEWIRTMAKGHSFDIEAIPMKNTHHKKMMELLIGRNLNWIR